MIHMILLSQSAWAYTWDSVEAPTGDSMTIQLCNGNFTASEVTEIFEAADAWHAGSGQLLRGALWEYIRGADRSAGTCGLGNNINEIYSRNNAWFISQGADDSLALTANNAVSVSTEVDFVWNTQYSADWTTDKPNAASSGDFSIGMIALHEFGHGLGFNHENTLIATMNDTYPNGGCISGEYRAHEDDYVGIITERSDASTGKNLLLGKFVENGSGNSTEVWDSATSDWTVCDYLVDPASDGPEGIYSIIYETSGTENPEVRWNLSADGNCFSGTEYTVGTRFPVLASNTPYLIQPNDYDFRGVPAASYFLCAKIDPDNDITETSNADNTLLSEVQVTVQDCP